MTRRVTPRRCAAKASSTGERCQKAPLRGGTVCYTHGGATRMVSGRAAVRAELTAWGLADEHVDPGEQLLRLVAQSSRRVSWLSAELERQVGQDAEDGEPSFGGVPKGLRALIGHKYDLTRDGDPVAVEEAVRGLARLEAEERDRLARFAKLALDAGIAERTVRIAERQGELLAGAVRRILDCLDLSPAQRVLVGEVVPRELRAIEHNAVGPATAVRVGAPRATATR